ncbi:MAG: sulfate adenylyltransferase subunit CysN [Deltaproteobacteria bacterium]|nr:sulfate adenylyltransferase subunit CysN [Deltaproteobacteria bacterium]
MEINERDREFISTDILGYLKQHEEKDLLRFITCGSVDDGKSTLIGRLLFDSKLIYEDQLAAVQAASTRHGTVGDQTDLALVTDGLRAEREQGITIDVAYRFFSTNSRKFIIADTPGHEQYTRNMATGASTADLAVILIDARHGILPQTKRHSFIASLLGIKHVLVAINKMDLVDWGEERYEEIRKEYTDFATRLEVTDVHFIPLSALLGDNVVHRSENMPWYEGPSVLHFLESVHIASDRNFIDFRFPVQHVVRPHLNFRGYQGTIAGGVVKIGDEVMVLPSGKRSNIERIVTFDGDLTHAFPPQAVTLTLTDEIDISRGDIIVKPNNTPRVEKAFEAMVVWMHDTPLREGRDYLLKSGTQLVTAEASLLRYRFDVNTLHKTEPIDVDGRPGLQLNEVGRLMFETTRPMAFDPYARNKTTGGFIVIDKLSNVTVGAGMILDRKADASQRSREEQARRLALLQASTGKVTAEMRAERFGHQPATVWLTGLPRAGKSTVAHALEQRLWDKGVATHVLDGVNLRLALSKDLGFTADERSEAGRRASEVARLFNGAGMVTIAAFASPYAADRDAARQTIGDDRFVEVFLDASVEVCEARDAELFPEGDGLYAKARRGEVKSFTGVSAPYERPESPALTINTEATSVDAAVETIVALLVERGVVGG